MPLLFQPGDVDPPGPLRLPPLRGNQEAWSVHFLAVGVRLWSKQLALFRQPVRSLNREATFAIIVRGREKIFEPSPFPPRKVTTPSQRTVDRTVKYAIYDRSSRGSSLPTSVGLRNSSSSTCIVPYGGHQQWTHQRSFSNVHSTLVFLPVKSSIYVNADRISRISINPPPPSLLFFRSYPQFSLQLKW